MVEPAQRRAVHRAIPNEPPHPMETKYRTIIQAAVLLVLLVCVVAFTAAPESSSATAQVANSE
jgi:hypothetical protein